MTKVSHHNLEMEVNLGYHNSTECVGKRSINAHEVKLELQAFIRYDVDAQSLIKLGYHEAVAKTTCLLKLLKVPRVINTRICAWEIR